MSASGIRIPSVIPRGYLAELYLVSALSPWLRALTALAAAVLTTAAGVELDALHRRFADEAASGAPLNWLTSLLASGSSPATVWPGWIAAACFGIALFRLRREPPEPPVGVGDADLRTVGELRAGLRHEYLAARIALVAVTLVCLCDIARVVTAALHPGGDPPGVGIASLFEASGLLAATAILGLWTRSFRDELERWGAL